MSDCFWLRASITAVLWATLTADRAWGLSVTAVNPANYQVAALSQGDPCYADAGGTVAGIPPALVGGTIIRTRASDASNSSLVVSFQVDVRAEVYVCYEAGASPPPWLSSWVKTDMTVAVSGGPAASYSVYAKRFEAGTVQLSQNQAAAMYFVAVKESLPIFPRCGWVLLSYDMPYLREIIRQAPLYHVNHIQLSHDIMMYIWQPLESPTLRADLNELIDLAHAYGITDVTVWTHEFGTHGLPNTCRENNSPTGRVDGDKAATWTWTRNCYNQLFSAGTGCPAVDGVVVTYSEVDGVELWDTTQFKYNGTGADAVKKSIQTVQGACHDYGKTFYARTWAGVNQFDVRDGVKNSNDTTTWMMSKNVGGTSGWDWQYMDTHLAVIGTLPAGFNEMIEFDLCGEYLGRSQYTFNMTSYLKDHWNYAYNLGVRGGIVARIDREGALTNFTANRIHLYALDQILADRNADPAAVNLAWCQQYFPADAAQDIADHYDDPYSPWTDDTRYMTWEAFFPDLSPVSNAQALSIGYAAIDRLDKHRAQLEIQTTIDTRNRKTDYQTLRNGIALSVLDLGGAVQNAYGYSNFQPILASRLSPDCTINIRVPSPGLSVTSVTCEYSTNGGGGWSAWPVACSGVNGSTNTETLSAVAVPFQQFSVDQNLVRFHIRDLNSKAFESGQLKVVTRVGPEWSTFQPTFALDLTPDCSVTVTTTGQPLDPATARYQYSTDGGQTWIAPVVNWDGRYECDKLPWQDGWTVVEGQTGYESVNNGILSINDNSTAGGTKVKYARPWNVDPSVGATVEARMQCLSGGHYFGCNIQVSDPLHYAALFLKANGMIGLYPTWMLVPTDTSSWHTYRVTIRNTDINVYIDGTPQPVLAGNGLFLSAADGLQQLLFGSGASAGTQYICYDYLYWTTAGSFPPPNPWRTATYAGAAQGGIITVSGVPFGRQSNTLNKIQFSIADARGSTWQSPVYNVAISDAAVWADFDHDGDIDQEDFGHMQLCLAGTGVSYDLGCQDADANSDGQVNSDDLRGFLRCMTGAGVLADANCLN
jgi:hypothetical protein